MREIVIDPVTRLEGHGKITIFLNDAWKRRKRILPSSRTTRI